MAEWASRPASSPASKPPKHAARNSANCSEPPDASHRFSARCRHQLLLRPFPAPFHDAGNARFLCRPTRQFRRRPHQLGGQTLRRIIPGIGGLDWSTVFAAFALQLLLSGILIAVRTFC
jgi:hypothetical protein